MTLQLEHTKPFAQGGNRLCFVHPEHADRCIKVRRPDFSLADLRRRKGFPKNLQPLSHFDDNAEEFKVMKRFQHRYGDNAFCHISRCYGFEDTDFGSGLVSELIRDEDQKISYSLKQYLIEFGYSTALDQAIAEFSEFWERECIPSRELLLHNVVVQKNLDGSIARLVVIDGLGSPNLIPYHWYPKALQRIKATKKVAGFRRRIDKIQREINSGKQFSQLGKLLHSGTHEQ